MKTSRLSRTILFSAIAYVGALFSSSAFAADSALSGKDKSFVQDAYQDGLAEVQTAQLAQQKTANAEVKAFAEKLVSDHMSANNKLKSLADSKKVSLASDASLVAKGKAKMLDTKSAGAFDKAFIDHMISDHKKAIEVFRKGGQRVPRCGCESTGRATLAHTQVASVRGRRDPE